jgi:hypothetical protein
MMRTLRASMRKIMFLRDAREFRIDMNQLFELKNKVKCDSSGLRHVLLL